MSSTYSSGKKVTAIRAANGKILYALYEETCESNLYPRTPSWCCVAVGYLESVMNRIFLSASAAEGGCLKGAGGRSITPEGYIQGWLKALANPFAQCDILINAYCAERSSAPVPKEYLDRIAPALIERGFEALVNRLRAGEEVPLSLNGTPDEIDALFGKGYAWKMLSGGPTSYHEAPDLAYAPAPSKVIELPTAELRTFTRKNYYRDTLMQKLDGVWTHAGSCYDALVEFLRNDCAAHEVKFPGTYRKRIKAYRALLDAAQPVETSQFVVVIDSKKIESEWKRSTLAKLCERIEHELAGDMYRFKADEIPDEVSHEVEYLHDATTFDFTRAVSRAAPVVQLDLLMA